MASGRDPFCNVCLADLTQANWHESNRREGRRRYLCKRCWNERQRGYEAKLPPGALKARKKRNLSAAMARDPDGCADASYNRWLRRNYGITIHQYRAMERQQDHRCAICFGGPNGRGRFHVDHDHTTGHVRGLLCAKCNLLLGHADDDIARLESAIDYLRR